MLFGVATIIITFVHAHSKLIIIIKHFINELSQSFQTFKDNSYINVAIL